MGVRFVAPPARAVILLYCWLPATSLEDFPVLVNLASLESAGCYRLSACVGQQGRCLLTMKERLDRLIQVIEDTPPLLGTGKNTGRSMNELWWQVIARV